MPERAYREGVLATFNHTRGIVSRGLSAVLVGLVACGVGGCSAQSVDSVREKFVAAGGSCETWAHLDDSRALDAITCSDGAQLYLFDGDAGRSDFVKSELESNTNIRARTHIILSGENWLIIDRIAVIVRVMPTLHGIIQGRNGANP